MKVILDAFGGDNSPNEVIKGAYLAVCKDPSVEVILCGNEEIIKKVISENNYSHNLIAFSCRLDIRTEGRLACRAIDEPRYYGA